MTNTDRQRLADFDARVTGWSFVDNEVGWPRIHHDALFLRRLLREFEAEVNNREVEPPQRRRAARVEGAA